MKNKHSGPVHPKRIPRYKLLLSELLRFTNPSFADYAPLSRALDLIGQVAMHINEAVRLQQNTQALLTLQHQFNDALQLIGSNGNGVPGPRRLLKQGALPKKGRRHRSINAPAVQRAEQ